MTEDEMVGWYHRLSGHECEQTLNDSERVTGRKAKGFQMEETGCKCQTFLFLLSGRRKQTSNIFSFSIQI